MEDTLKVLYKRIIDRKENNEEGSYTSYLFSKGKEKILKKIGEECTEVVISSLNDDKEQQVNEVCDLTYHLLVLLAELNIPLESIDRELNKRSNKLNNFKGERKDIEII